MYAITGATGKVGGVVARTLIEAGESVRVVVRDAQKGMEWEELGCEVAVARMEDATALALAFKGASAVFILPPPIFDPSPGFPEVRAVVAAVRSALRRVRPVRVVCISTIGAQVTRSNLLTQLTIVERELGELPVPVAFLRPAWYMENYSWDVASARDSGVLPSFLQPLGRSVPMVATADVGRVAAEMLRQNWTGRRVVELEGPRRVTPNEAAATFVRLLGRSVRAEAVPREIWRDLFTMEGMKDPVPRIQMLDGFNEGWIDFEMGEARTRKGKVDLELVLRDLIEQQAEAQLAAVEV